MGDSRPSHLHLLYEAALEDYKHQTGIELAEHPLAVRLQDCNSVESVVSTIFREQAQDVKEFGERDTILTPFKKVLTVLHGLSSAASVVCPQAPMRCSTFTPLFYSISRP
jgi:hypothetical protein